MLHFCGTGCIKGDHEVKNNGSVIRWPILHAASHIAAVQPDQVIFGGDWFYPDSTYDLPYWPPLTWSGGELERITLAQAKAKVNASIDKCAGLTTISNIPSWKLKGDHDNFTNDFDFGLGTANGSFGGVDLGCDSQEDVNAIGIIGHELHEYYATGQHPVLPNMVNPVNPDAGSLVHKLARWVANTVLDDSGDPVVNNDYDDLGNIPDVDTFGFPYFRQGYRYTGSHANWETREWVVDNTATADVIFWVCDVATFLDRGQGPTTYYPHDTADQSVHQRRTMLGETQLDWLIDGINGTPAGTINIIVWDTQPWAPDESINDDTLWGNTNAMAYVYKEERDYIFSQTNGKVKLVWFGDRHTPHVISKRSGEDPTVPAGFAAVSMAPAANQVNLINSSYTWKFNQGIRDVGTYQAVSDLRIFKDKLEIRQINSETNELEAKYVINENEHHLTPVGGKVMTKKTVTINVVDLGSGAYGYQDGSGGSIDDNTWQNTTIERIRNDTNDRLRMNFDEASDPGLWRR